MTLHLQKSLDLPNIQIFPVAQRDQLIKSAQQLICIPQNLPFV